MHQSMLQREQRRTGPGGYAGLAVQALAVVVARLGGDPQPPRDLLGGQPAGEQAKHLAFALGKPGGPVSRCLPRRGSPRRLMLPRLAPVRRPAGRFLVPPLPGQLLAGRGHRRARLASRGEHRVHRIGRQQAGPSPGLWLATRFRRPRPAAVAGRIQPSAPIPGARRPGAARRREGRLPTSGRGPCFLSHTPGNAGLGSYLRGGVPYGMNSGLSATTGAASSARLPYDDGHQFRRPSSTTVDGPSRVRRGRRPRPQHPEQARRQLPRPDRRLDGFRGSPLIWRRGERQERAWQDAGQDEEKEGG